MSNESKVPALVRLNPDGASKTTLPKCTVWTEARRQSPLSAPEPRAFQTSLALKLG